MSRTSIKTLCPSGLRGWTQVPLARAAWVQIPQVSCPSCPRTLRAVLQVTLLCSLVAATGKTWPWQHVLTCCCGSGGDASATEVCDLCRYRNRQQLPPACLKQRGHPQNSQKPPAPGPSPRPRGRTQIPPNHARKKGRAPKRPSQAAGSHACAGLRVAVRVCAAAACNSARTATADAATATAPGRCPATSR